MQLADAIMAPCTWVPGRRAECLDLRSHLSWFDLVTAAELLEELPRLVSDLVDPHSEPEAGVCCGSC